MEFLGRGEVMAALSMGQKNGYDQSSISFRQENLPVVDSVMFVRWYEMVLKVCPRLQPEQLKRSIPLKYHS